MPCIPDASVAIGWSLPDEMPPYAMAVLDRIVFDGAVVPAIWRIEVANTLAVAERRRRVPRAESAAAVGRLRRLRIEVDSRCVEDAFDAVLTLARDYSLTAYDGCYLELALRLSLPLATRDEQLIAAAERAGVEVLA